MCKYIRKIIADRGGNFASMLALLLLPLTIAVGFGVDGTRVLLTHYKFQAALDSAALAVGSTYEDRTELERMMDLFVEKNFDVPSARVVKVELGSQVGEKVVVSGTAELDTYFMRVVGTKTVDVDATSEVKRAGGGLIVSLVLDNTGSMWSSNNIGSLRDSTVALLDSMFSKDKNPDNLRMSIVPYASTVNPGAEAESIVVPHTYGLRSDTDKTKWKGCVVERAGADSIADTPPSDGLWTAFWYPEGIDDDYDIGDAGTIDPGPKNSNGVTGPNIGCPTPITPLTNSYDTLKSAANAMSAWNRGGTLTDIGVAWGLRVLSEGEPFDESKEIDKKTGKTIWQSEYWQKAMVIMTDGESQFYDLPGTAWPNQAHSGHSDYTGYGRLGETLADGIFNSTSKSTVKNKLNSRIADLCSTAKSLDITVYVIVFTSGVGSSVRDMYQDCASDPGKYWYAPNSSALKNSFQQVASDLSKLRLIR